MIVNLFSPELLRGSLRPLSAVLGTSLASVCNACRIQRSSDDMISGTRKVLDTSAADHDNTMFLKVMTLPRDIGCNFKSVGKTHTGDFTKSRIRLLRGCSLDAVDFFAAVCLPFLTNWLNVGIPLSPPGFLRLLI